LKPRDFPRAPRKWLAQYHLSRLNSTARAADLQVAHPQNGTSFFVTPAQEKMLDCIANGTALVWFGPLSLAVVARTIV
jgi:hypothetical protein